MLESVKETFDRLMNNEKMREDLNKNKKWALANFEFLCANFLNKWVAIDEERYLKASPNLEPMMNMMRLGGSLSPTVIFIYCGYLVKEPMMVVTHEVLDLVD